MLALRGQGPLANPLGAPGKVNRSKRLRARLHVGLLRLLLPCGFRVRVRRFTGFNGEIVEDADAEGSDGAEIGIFNVGGDVTLTGAISVDSDAAITVGKITVKGGAEAIAEGSGNANATFTGIDNGVLDETEAESDFDIGNVGGNVGVTGDVTVTADATTKVGNIGVTGEASASVAPPD